MEETLPVSGASPEGDGRDEQPHRGRRPAPLMPIDGKRISINRNPVGPRLFGSSADFKKVAD